MFLLNFGKMDERNVTYLTHHTNKPTTWSSCAVNQTEVIFFPVFFLFISLLEPLNQKCLLNILAQLLLNKK